MDQDLVFKALSDPSRRTLLDALFQEDGQTLTELQARLPMTRFGAMKHLNLLEEAGLITTRKVGREKFHYLNPVPIQQVYDRWVTKYSRGWTRGLTSLKDQLEGKIMPEKHSHVYSIFIQTTPEKLWRALTNGDMTQQYYFGTRFASSLKKGAPYDYLFPDGKSMLHGEILESDPPRKLVTTFKPLWVENAASAPISKVTFEIEPRGPACKLTLIHDDLEAGSPLTQGMVEGWAQIFSGLKTLLETGEPMPA
jgi:uncharacterized protein YndB with AHSA1/START domain/DNA-binding transcriptional ArsR family regulator